MHVVLMLWNACMKYDVLEWRRLNLNVASVRFTQQHKNSEGEDAHSDSIKQQTSDIAIATVSQLYDRAEKEKNA